MLLMDQVAIVTGAASKRGLGRAIAWLFAGQGAKVAVLDLDENQARLAAAALPGQGHLGIACDVTDRERCIAAVAVVLATFGKFDVLVNNAGITSPQRLMEVTPESLDRILDVNLKGTFHMTQAVVPHMRQRRHGSIINMASVSGQRGGGVFGGTHYAAAKAGVAGYTKACARELAPDNVRVNCICPSWIDTDIITGMTPERRRELINTIPMGRPGEAHEVAGAALFLASDLASYVTGIELDVNGGSHIH
jgi:NAD(P)-dependent dehydrogenase (short-subunit alcohol dehydrogenase family)